MPWSTAERPVDTENRLLRALDERLSPNSPAYHALLTAILRTSTHEDIVRARERHDYGDCLYDNFKAHGVSLCFDAMVDSATGDGNASGSNAADSDDSKYALAAIHLYNDHFEQAEAERKTPRAPNRTAPFHAYRWVGDNGQGEMSTSSASPSSPTTAKQRATTCSLLPLPYNLTRDTTLRDAIHKFAPVEPTKGGGGPRGSDLNVWIRYERYGVQMEFPARGWDEGEVRWCEMILTRVAGNGEANNGGDAPLK